MTTSPHRPRRRLATTALLAGVGLGAGIGAAGIASAATGSPSTTAPASAPATAGTTPTDQPPQGRPPVGAPDPATMPHGPGETLLTGSDLARATAAAQAAQPGATVVRAESDSSGTSTYEVHMKKADGTFVTVHLDGSFAVTSTADGFGPGPAGGRPPAGGPQGPIGPAPAGGTPASGAPSGTTR